MQDDEAMQDRDDWTLDMLRELRSCSDSSVYFYTKYMDEATAEQQFLAWDAFFNENRSNVALYPTIRLARESLSVVMSLYEDMPQFLLPEVLYRTTTEVLFENGSSLSFKIGRTHYVQGRSISNLALSTRLTKAEHSALRDHVKVLKLGGAKVHYF